MIDSDVAQAIRRAQAAARELLHAIDELGIGLYLAASPAAKWEPTGVDDPAALNRVLDHAFYTRDACARLAKVRRRRKESQR